MEEEKSLLIPNIPGCEFTGAFKDWPFSTIYEIEEKEDKTKAVEVLKLDMDEEKRDKILCSWEDTEVSAGTYQGYIVRFHTNPYNEVNLDYAEL
ncbi:hypothetical protein A3K02_00510 [candidate division WS6 bacterium RIFOXYD1_FULL_33_8]|nr:MAG: hypothetical protein UR36_C0006G0017 [candidate division WS6 bacterium GW2011_GWF1_33_233]KKP54813.1 MAG: hypothetical protein UR47_C0010G0029 [candidate division WS6 bacterium GW2011_GWB1_33_6]KKP55004.1 MAG: hypothetical protein UR45_C0006G0018 [candidate division WS6 bacterium GW2011_WS6_33_547]KKP56804.1 MAG: hypothetical protein UR49_C0008G0017 [candidate division WS6 bacterium GW2011_GWF2_33_92]OGC36673.1 MAG: hypothetical protein A2369_01845 [candidate division WS6 bacterium RIFO